MPLFSCFPVFCSYARPCFIAVLSRFSLFCLRLLCFVLCHFREYFHCLPFSAYSTFFGTTLFFRAHMFLTQLSPPLTFGKIFSRFSDTLFCALLQPPGACRQPTCFRTLFRFRHLLRAYCTVLPFVLTPRPLFSPHRPAHFSIFCTFCKLLIEGAFSAYVTFLGTNT